MLHFGLHGDDLAKTQANETLAMVEDAWARSFMESAGYGPSEQQRQDLRDSLDRVKGAGHLVADVCVAAATAGAYQDPNLTTCLPRHLSAVGAAAHPISS
ncbi:hypothetical protein [Streptomyces sp. NBRC 110035]|uniref:hypothetical protein n=1 Tax=Streptomyces sp. NBRC 110035 TaxID=1547867 RepID=UPI0005A7F847|nr:hypothetical protein [Streptomyces sp. NBRC 110035]